MELGLGAHQHFWHWNLFFVTSSFSQVYVCLVEKTAVLSGGFSKQRTSKPTVAKLRCSLRFVYLWSRRQRTSSLGGPQKLYWSWERTFQLRKKKTKPWWPIKNHSLRRRWWWWRIFHFFQKPSIFTTSFQYYGGTHKPKLYYLFREVY